MHITNRCHYSLWLCRNETIQLLFNSQEFLQDNYSCLLLHNFKIDILTSYMYKHRNCYVEINTVRTQFSEKGINSIYETKMNIYELCLFGEPKHFLYLFNELTFFIRILFQILKAHKTNFSEYFVICFLIRKDFFIILIRFWYIKYVLQL